MDTISDTRPRRQPGPAPMGPRPPAAAVSRRTVEEAPSPVRLGDTRPAPAKDPDDRVVSGVAAGIAEWLGVDSGVVRLATVVLATAGGAGILLYVLGHVLLPEGPPARPASRGPGSGRRALGFGLIVAGLLLVLRAAGVWIADTLTWSVGLAAIGSAVVWTRADDSERDRWRRSLQHAVGQRALPDLASLGRFRLSIGAILLVAGVWVFVVTIDVSAAPEVLLASLLAVVGVGLVVGPWLQQLARQVSEERRERIRSEERAEMAAHLHDSVLQTLALIQRAGSPEEMSRLARGQERELRAWLFGRRPDDAPIRLGQAVEDAAGRVEDRFGVKAEVVLAGDVVLDTRLVGLVDAAAEAMANAARHAGVDAIDVFVEVEPDAVTVFVRDEGSGFDPDTIDGDRRGVAESILGRMRRHGGSATIHSGPGEGTEVELRLPLAPGAEEDQETAAPEQPQEH